MIFRTYQSTTIMEEMKTSSSVMDLSMGASLVRGKNKDNIYEWPSALHLT
ncbi:hypothetical protein B296_00013055 [Ensete ventricosum]|uniref:Uncharacterized protein n=1 Tax=Ensete ventricosum TaxID=4639 RepID=A0A427AZ94_ENSVE|nr:hypothetical protein B296_00013055 [Ensete ventricosum]